jgi:hypothetical protein
MLAALALRPTHDFAVPDRVDFAAIVHLDGAAPSSLPSRARIASAAALASAISTKAKPLGRRGL